MRRTSTRPGIWCLLPPDADETPADGLYRATLKGGYGLALMVTPITGDTGVDVWHSLPSGKTFQASGPPRPVGIGSGRLNLAVRRLAPNPDPTVPGW